MEELEPGRRNAVSLVARCVILVTMGAVLATLLVVMLNAAAATPQTQTRKGLMILAIICLAVLAVTVVLLVWTIVRYLAMRAEAAAMTHTKTEHVDAWELAGKRFRLSDDDPDAPEVDGDANDGGGEDRPDGEQGEDTQTR